MGVVGYVVPFMIFATVMLSVGMGLLTTLAYDSPMRYILGYQVPAGIGIGIALQQTVLATQIVLPMADIPTGVSLIVLAQTLGGTISLSGADTIFTSLLTSGISSAIPQISGDLIMNSGATNLRELVPAQYISKVLEVYNDAVMKALYLSVALGSFSIIGCLGMEWKHVNPTKSQETDSSEAVGSQSVDVLQEGAAATEKAPEKY